jgi:hypothetical protein
LYLTGVEYDAAWGLPPVTTGDGLLGSLSALLANGQD